MSGTFAAALFFIVGVYVLRSKNVNAFCVKYSHDGFFIYAFHWFILSYVQRAFSLWGQNCLIVLAKDILMPFCCVLICILVHRLILKILPSKFYKLLGDR